MRTKLKTVKYVEFLLKNQVVVITLHAKSVNINGVGYVDKIIQVIILVLG